MNRQTKSQTSTGHSTAWTKVPKVCFSQDTMLDAKRRALINLIK